MNVASQNASSHSIPTPPFYLSAYLRRRQAVSQFYRHCNQLTGRTAQLELTRNGKSIGYYSLHRYSDRHTVTFTPYP
ncbi:hypothetical protein [Spirosoma sp. KNUC1025]|uniref:hypothetical protein n=1 Tax=Spirosoma sp. KNUC1025 TaxID=2894082 RepID=UPI0038634891|nr:hypothetical protein LN737_19345 [Spirosoma sp. KNUC1025]